MPCMKFEKIIIIILRGYSDMLLSIFKFIMLYIVNFICIKESILWECVI